MGNELIEFEDFRVKLEKRGWHADESNGTYMLWPPENNDSGDTSDFKLVLGNDSTIRVYSENFKNNYYSLTMLFQKGVPKEMAKAIIWYFELKKERGYNNIIWALKETDNITRIYGCCRNLKERFDPEKEKFYDENNKYHERAFQKYQEIDI